VISRRRFVTLPELVRASRKKDHSYICRPGPNKIRRNPREFNFATRSPSPSPSPWRERQIKREGGKCKIYWRRFDFTMFTSRSGAAKKLKRNIPPGLISHRRGKKCLRKIEIIAVVLGEWRERGWLMDGDLSGSGVRRVHYYSCGISPGRKCVAI
jgi:hypothetical protein